MMETRRTHSGFLTESEAARDRERTGVMVRGIVENCFVCGICGKTSVGKRWTITPLAYACSDCWNYLYGPIRKSTRNKITHLFEDATFEFSQLKENIKNLKIEKKRLESETHFLKQANSALKRNLAKIYCKHLEIKNLYHITPMENIASIFQHGLLCLNLIDKENLPRVSCSYSEIQERRSHVHVGKSCANDYVPLYFSEKSPMLCFIEHNNPENIIVYICVKGEILGEEEVHFSDGNIAAWNNTRIFNSVEELEKLDWKKIRAPSWIFSDEMETREAKRIKAAEVLVPSRIDPSWFQKIIVPHQNAASELEKLLPKSITIEVRPDFYFRRQ